MKDLGEAKKILGMEIKRDRHSKNLYLSQKEYLKRAIDQFGMNENTKSVSTPRAPHFKLSAAMSLKNEAEHICTIQETEHWQAVKWILRNIRNIVDVGLFFEQEVSWKSTLHSTVASSTTEAEYMQLRRL
ncbi:PREDICTED: uncharacterized protein LOC109209398 [Nicotiana attenuata]|uniref:uncharacterized protein LOC109209398 n=1 Tax=Nicotiana attenuata TaxID=49451 RepID=UPI00090563BD|nr:PREDICTED: uncharacterized protein LOC109209398 [Nicotiana attenuata]